MAEGYRKAPVPKKVRRLGQDAVDIYMEQLDQLIEQRVQPLEAGNEEAVYRLRRTSKTVGCFERIYRRSTETVERARSGQFSLAEGRTDRGYHRVG